MRGPGEIIFPGSFLRQSLKKGYGNSVPAISTVYRLITKLVTEGSVRRFVKGHSRRFLYQIVDRDHCRSHLHLRCMDCGKLIHLNEKVSDELLTTIRSANNFSVNEEETVLVGACSDCSRMKKDFLVENK